ncbi:MAG: ribonuclease H-like domain-containing protein [Spirochaetota bacterium]
MADRSKLVERLSHIRHLRKGTDGITPREKRETESGGDVPDLSLSGGWKRIGDFCYLREIVYPDPLPETFEQSFLLAPGTSRERLLFFDTETTGLSGGAGTFVFLVGLAVSKGGTLTLRQFFLADYPGEGEFLAALLKEMKEDGIYVSYNGKAFDSQILSSRFLLNRLHFRFPDQLDLLYPSRRLFRNVIGSCALSNIEERIFCMKRLHDVPGYLVPEYYFNFLRTGRMEVLKDVFNHNIQDILSLVQLLLLIDTICVKPEDLSNVDSHALGSMLLEKGLSGGEKVLARAFKAGDYQAGKTLGRYYKQSKNLIQARSLWERMWLDKKSVYAGVELAKYYEHAAKDYKTALKIVEAMLTFIDTGLTTPARKKLQEELTHRAQRLQARLRRSLNNYC